MLGTITLLPVSQYSIFLLHMKGNVHLYTVIAEFFYTFGYLRCLYGWCCGKDRFLSGQRKALVN